MAIVAEVPYFHIFYLLAYKWCTFELIMSSHLISPLESCFCSFASFFHWLDKDAKSPLAPSLHAEVQWGFPGRLLQGDLPQLSLGCTRNVQQSQMAFHFLTMGNEREDCDSNLQLKEKVSMLSWCWIKYKLKAEWCLTVVSRSFSKSSRKRLMCGLPSKSLKWLLTHSNTILVTCSDITSHVSCVPLC